MSKILLTTHYGEEPLKIVKALVPENFELITLSEISQEELYQKCADVEYILASGRLKIDETVLENAYKLKMIQRTGVGIDSLDLTAITKKNIPVYVNKGINSSSVAEHTILFMLTCLRRLPEISSNFKKGIWKKQEQGIKTRELSSQTVGIVGAGHIGQEVAKILKSFGANVVYYNRHRLSEEKEKDLLIKYVDLDTLYQISDIISLHCPLNSSTYKMIEKDSIGKMKHGAIIINTARGGLINEDDLLSALEDGHLSYAALDVFEDEPTHNFRILNADNILATPHIAGITYDSFYTMIKHAMQNIYSFENGDYDSIANYKLC